LVQIEVHERQVICSNRAYNRIVYITSFIRPDISRLEIGDLRFVDKFIRCRFMSIINGPLPATEQVARNLSLDLLELSVDMGADAGDGRRPRGTNQEEGATRRWRVRIAN
jgi:hypothetical protein